MRYFCFFVWCAFMGCTTSQTTRDPQSLIFLTPDLVTEQLHDTLFVRCNGMFSANGRVCIGDYDGGRIICTDVDFQAQTILGRKGLGPGEIMYPGHGVYYEGQFFIYDAGKKSIQVFGEEGVFIKEVRLPAEYDNYSTFAIGEDGDCYLGTGFVSSVGLRFDLDSQKTVSFFGVGDKAEDEKKAPANLLRLKDGHLISILETLPRIVVYGPDLKARSTYDLSDDELVKGGAEFRKVKGDPHAFMFSVFGGAQLDTGTNRLYVLVFGYEPGDDNTAARTIYEFQYQDGSLSHRSTYRLTGPEESKPAFLSFAVVDKQIFTYDLITELFYRYPLPG
ncbi:MAG: hypothetical protein R3D00_07680 [Bacteroidia bacterium]